MSFGSIVREKRKGKRLSLREVSGRVGVNPSYLSRVEGDKVRPSPHLVEKLAPVLDFPADELAVMAGQLPPRFRSALKRKGAAPADALSELAILYAAEPSSGPAAPPKRNRTGRGSTSDIRSRTTVSRATKSLSLFPEVDQGGSQTPLVQQSQGSTPAERRIDPRNRLNALTSVEWIPETVSVWTQRGLGAGHADAQIERQHPAPFSFTDVARLVRFFSKPGELVLDPFVGIGSTLKACALERRRGIGVELNPRYAQLTRERLKKEVRGHASTLDDQTVLEGDSRKVLPTLEADSVDFVVTSPPYWNILHKEDHKAKQERKAHALDTKYSDDPRDLGNVKAYDAFLDDLTAILGQCGRVLRKKKYMAVVVSDFRDKSRFIMFHSDLARSLQAYRFGLRGIKVLYQRHKKIFPYGYPYAYVPNIHHQYILILQNER